MTNKAIPKLESYEQIKNLKLEMGEKVQSSGRTYQIFNEKLSKGQSFLLGVKAFFLMIITLCSPEARNLWSFALAGRVTHYVDYDSLPVTLIKSNQIASDRLQTPYNTPVKEENKIEKENEPAQPSESISPNEQKPEPIQQPAQTHERKIIVTNKEAIPDEMHHVEMKKTYVPQNVSKNLIAQSERKNVVSVSGEYKIQIDIDKELDRLVCGSKILDKENKVLFDYEFNISIEDDESIIHMSKMDLGQEFEDEDLKKILKSTLKTTLESEERFKNLSIKDIFFHNRRGKQNLQLYRIGFRLDPDIGMYSYKKQIFTRETIENTLETGENVYVGTLHLIAGKDLISFISSS